MKYILQNTRLIIVFISCFFYLNTTAQELYEVCECDSLELCVTANFATYDWFEISMDTTTAAPLSTDRCFIPVNNGTYYAVTTEGDCCRTETPQMQVIIHPEIDDVTVVTTNASCDSEETGSVTLNGVTGGTGPFTFEISNGTTTQTGNTATFGGLAAGGYIYTVTDANGCVYKSSFFIDDPSDLEMVVTSENDETCVDADNGSASVLASGGTPPYTYLWTPGGYTTASASNLQANFYLVAVTDANGCNVVASLEIEQPDTLSIALLGTTDVTCNGTATGSAVVTGTGGTLPYTFTSTSGSVAGNVITGLPVGTHTITITDNNSCTKNLMVTITEPNPLLVNISGNDPTCSEGISGSIDLIVSGGTAPYNYIWNTGSTDEDLNNLEAGVYEVEVMDANGCMVTTDIELTDPEGIDVKVDPIDANCDSEESGSVEIFADNGVAPYTFSLSNGETNTTGSFSTLATGGYTYTVTDANNCMYEGSFEIDDPSDLEAYISSQTNETCTKSDDGTASILVSGGTAPYTYLWSSGAQTTATASDLPEGTHTVIVTDANGCDLTLSTTIEAPTPIEIDIVSQTNVGCNGTTTGNVSVVGSGGTPPYTFSSTSGSVSGNIINGLAEGVHTITITDDNGCINTIPVTITEPDVLTVAINGVNPICNGEASGGIFINVEGGTEEYLYEWNTGSTDRNLNNVVAGTYSVVVTDENGCTATATATITDPTAMSATATPTDADCDSAETGSVTIDGIIGGTAPYSISISNGSAAQIGTTATFTELATGGYIYTVTDANGCSYQSSFEIDDPSDLEAYISNQTDETCFENNDGTAIVTVAGGVSPYSYLWSDAQTTATASNLSAGVHAVTVTDANGCSVVASLEIKQPDVLDIILLSQTNTDCNGNSTGSVTVDATGGTSPYTYTSTSGTVSGNMITGLSAGTHTITVTDANSCTQSMNVTITEPVSLIVTATGTNPVCNGENTGSIAISVSGGTQEYHYLWNTGSTDSTLNNVGAGIYSITVTDENGCTATTVAAITDPNPMSATAISTNADCDSNETGSVTINGITGGTAPYTISISNGSAAQTGTTATFIELATGGYIYTVTDANGCSYQGSFEIDDPSDLEAYIPSQTDETCFENNDGTATVTVTGGTSPYSYLWSDAQTTATASNLGAGVHAVTVTDANGCSVVASLQINQPDSLDIVLVSQTDTDCNGNGTGSVTVGATGGTSPYTYTSTSGTVSGNMITGLEEGTHTITIMDANDCTQSMDVTITEPVSLMVTATGTNPVCNGENTGSIAISVSGGTQEYHYLWNTGSTDSTLNNVGAGTYTVTVTDENNCTATASATITDPTILTATAIPANADCDSNETGSVTINGITGGTAPYSISISNGSAAQTGTTATFTELATGGYIYTVTDANSCSYEGSFEIDDPSDLEAYISDQTDETCFENNDGTATVTVIGGTSPYSYLWSDAQTTVTASNLGAGVHTVTVTDANNCSIIASLEISQPDSLDIVLVSQTDTDCNGNGTGSVTVDATGGTSPYTYTSTSGTVAGNMITDLFAGTHTITVTDANTCTQSFDVMITNPVSLMVTATGTNPVCNGKNTGSIAISVSGGTQEYHYLWNTGSTDSTLNNVGAGTYTVTVTDENNCTATASATITDPTILTATSIPVNADCDSNETGSVTINGITGGTAPYSISISNGSAAQTGTTATFTELATGGYIYTVTDANNCSYEGSFEIDDPSDLEAYISGQTDETCFENNDGTATVTVTGGTSPYSYLWSDAQTTATASNLDAGIHAVTVTDANGCSVVASLAINQPDSLDIALINQINIGCNGENTGSVTLVGNGGTSPYIFSSTSGVVNGNTVTALVAGIHTITLTDANNCIQSIDVTITESSSLSVTIDVINPTCNGGDDGQAVAVPTGGLAPYFYEWVDGSGNVVSTDAVITNLIAGMYTINIVDVNGCTGTANVTLVPTNLLPNPVITTSNTEICASDAPTILTATGGTFILVEWYLNGIALVGTGATYNAYESGDYTIVVTDGNGCMNTSSAITIIVNENPEPTLIVEGNGTFCDGFNIDLTATLGYVNYSFEMLGGGVVQNSSNHIYEATQTGNYAVTVTDANGCIGTSDTIMVTVDALPEPIIQGVPTDTLCEGSCAQLYVPGLYQQITWYEGDPTDLANATILGNGNPFDICATGDYFVHVFDESDGQTCEGYSPVITINVEALTPITITADNATKCSVDAPVVLTATNVNGAIYDWYLNGTDLVQSSSVNVYNANMTGVYSVEVITSNGCLNQGEGINVTINPMPFVDAGLDQTICIGEAVELNINSDAPIVSIIAMSGDTGDVPTCTDCTNPLVSPIQTTTYLVTVSTPSGCIMTDEVTVTVNLLPTPIIVNNGDDEICSSDAPTILTATGGTFILVEWYLNGITLVGTGATYNAYESGDYTIVVTDGNGCMNTSSAITITVNENPEPTLIAEGNGTFCESFNLDLTATLGYINYSFEMLGQGVVQNGLNNIYEALQTGSYAVTVTDANGCIGTSDTIIVTVDALPEPIIQGVPTDTLCEGSCAQLYVPGLYQQITWYEGDPTDLANATILGNGNPFDICATGDYFVHVFDESDGQTCEGYSPVITINVEALTPIVITADNATKCAADVPVVLTATNVNGAIYNWYLNGTDLVQSSGVNVYNANMTGVYSVEVITSNGCLNQSEGISVIINPMPFVDAGLDQTICIGEEVELNINSDAPIISIVAISGDTGDIPTCTDCTNPLVTPIQTTRYLVTVSTPSGCIMTDDVVVVVNSLPTPSIVNSGNDEICGSEVPVILNATGGVFAVVEWYLNGITLVGTGATYNAYESGDYTIVVTDGNGCMNTSSTITVIVNENPEPTLVAEGNGTFCDGFNIDLIATAGYVNYSFEMLGGGIVQNGSNNIYEAIQTGDYAVTVIDINGCIGTSDTILVAVDALPNPIVEGVPTDTLCSGECADLYVVGIYQSVIWYQGNPNDLSNATEVGAGSNFQACQSGTYFVHVIDEADGQNCEGYSLPIEVVVESPIIVEITADALEKCITDAPIILTAPTYIGATYNWYLNGEELVFSSTNAIYEAISSGTYTVEIITAEGCANVSTGITIIIHPMPFIEAGENQTICIGESIGIDIDTELGISAIIPIMGDLSAMPSCFTCNNPTFTPTTTTTYEVIATSSFGCISKDTVTIVVNNLPTPSIVNNGSSEICESDAPIVLNATDGDFTLIEWYLNGITLVGTGATYDTYISGDYTITVTDENGCSNTSSAITITIDENPVPELISEGNGTFCDGFDIDLTATTGYVNYIFEMLGSGIVQNGVNNVYEATQSGIYTVTVTDANGCIGTSEPIEVSVDPVPNPIIQGVPTDTLCSNECVQLYVEGFYQQVTWYQGNPNDLNNAIVVGNGNPFNICEEGNYFVHVFDESTGQTCEGYSPIITINVEEPIEITISADISEKCEKDAPIELKATPLILGATYNWYLNGTDLLQTGSSNLYNAFESGVYSVEVITNNGCFNTSEGINIIINPMPFVDAGLNQVICIGEEVELDINSDVAIAQIVAISGDLTDAISCLNCNNPIVSPIETTTYEVTVTTTEGCSSTDQVMVTVNPLPTPVIFNVGDLEVCASDAPITLRVVGQQIYTNIEWYLDGITLVGTNNTYDAYESGIYTVVVTDQNGCSNTSDFVEVIIHENPTPSLIAEGNNTFCEGGDITLTVEESFETYLFEQIGIGIVQNGNSNMFIATQSGDYVVNVQDEFGCFGESDTISISIDPLPNPIIEGVPKGILCEGDCANLYVVGVYQSVIWYQGDPTDLANAIEVGAGNDFPACENGTYFAYVLDEAAGQDCEGYSLPVIIKVENPIDIQIVTDATEKCEKDAPIILTATAYPNTIYNWYLNGTNLLQSTNNNVYQAYETGTYSVEIISENNCVYTSNGISLTIHPMPLLDIGQDQEICLGESIELSIVSDGTISNIIPVSGDMTSTVSCICNNAIVNPNTNTTYAITVINEFGCTTIKEMNITVNDLPNPVIEAEGNTEICGSDAPVILSVIGETFENYAWYLDGLTLVGINNSYTATETGIYTVVVTDENGCNSTSNFIDVVIHENPLPTLLAESNNTFCEGGSITLTTELGYSNYIFTLLGVGIVQEGNNNTYIASQSGAYTVQVMDANGCIGYSNTLEISVDPLPNPVIMGVPTQALCTGECVNLYVTGIYQEVTWYQGNPNDLANAIEMTSGNDLEVCISGSYFVHVVDEADGQNCEGYSLPININIDTPIILEIITDANEKCEEDAPIIFNATNYPNATYNWYLNGVDLLLSSNSNIYTTNISGTYSVEIIDDQGCSNISEGVSVIVHSMPIVDTGENKEICVGESTELSLVTNAIITNIIAISGDLNDIPSCINCNNPTVSPIISTVYEISVSNEFGCSVTDIVEVIVNELPMATINIGGDSEVCAEDAPIILQAVGNNVSTIEWYLDNITLVGTGTILEANVSGNYTVVVTNENGCSQISNPVNINIYENPMPTLTATGNGTFCEGFDIELTATSGFAHYIFETTDGTIIQNGASNTISTNISGDYFVTVMNDTGCEGTSETINISIDSTPTPVIEGVPTQSLCNGNCATLYTLGNYQQITWYQGNPNDLASATIVGAGATFEACVSGEYFVYVLDEADGQTCEGYSVSINISIDEPLDVVIAGTDVEVCEEDAPVTLTATNLDNVTYNWYLNNTSLIQSGTNNTLTLTQNGTYSVEVINDEGCSVISNGINVNIVPMPTVNAGSDASICLGESTQISIITNANITQIIPISGDLNSTISCNTCNNPTVNPTITTVYEITASNDNGCTSTDQVEVSVNELAIPVINVEGSMIVCAEDAPVDLSITGNYSEIAWYKDEITLVGNTNNFQAFESGTYTVTVTDFNGCSNTAESVNIIVEENPNPELTITGDGTFCQGGSVEFVATDGYDSYEWYLMGTGLQEITTSNTFVASTDGTYYVIAYNNSCIGQSESVSISIDGLPEPKIVTIGETTICNGESVQLAIVGDYVAIQWYGDFGAGMIPILGANTTVFETTIAGTYQVFVSDGNDCEGYSNEQTVIVYDEESLVIQEGNITACPEELPIVLTATEGFDTYTWTRNGTSTIQSGEANTLVIDIAGDYTVTGSTANDCSVEASGIAVELLSSPLVDIITRPYELCIGEEGVLEAATLLPNHNMVWTVSGNGNTTNLNGVGAHLMTFENAGLYEIEVVVTNQITGCKIVQNYTFEVYGMPTPQIVATTEGAICEGDAVNLQVTGDNFETQQWYFNGNPIFEANTSNIFANQNGTYSVLVSNQYDCQSEISTEIIVNSLPTFEVTTMSNGTFCEGLNNTISVTPDNYDTYEFVNLNTGETIQSSSANTLTVTEAGNYAITVSHQGCTGESQYIELSIDPTPQPIIYTANGNEACIEECINLFIAGNYLNIVWYEGDVTDIDNANIVGAGNNFDACTSGSYFVYVYDDATCEGYSDEFEVTIFEEVIVNVSTPSTDVCPEDLPVVLTANNLDNVTYTWYLNGVPQQSENSNIFNAYQTGIYQVTVDLNNGCQTTSNLTAIHVPSTPFVDAGIDQEICTGESTQIHINSSSDIESITPISGDLNATPSCLCNNPSVSPTETTMYEVVIVTTEGCTATDMVTVFVNQESQLIIESTNDGTCEGETAVLTALPNTHQQYNWYNEVGILIQTGSSNTLESTEAGIFTVVALQEDGCTIQASTSIVINEEPNIALTIEGTSSFCDGGMMLLQATEGMTQYDWYFNYVLLESNGSANYEATMDGIYYVVATDENGCTTESNPIVLSILSNPQPIITTNNDLSLCNGEEITLCVAQNYEVYHWYNVNDLMTLLSSDQCFTPTESGTYYVDVRDDSGCMGISQNITISYEGLEIPTVLTLSPEAQCGGSVELAVTPIEGVNYEWYYFGVPTGITTTTFQAENSGFYTVIASNGAGCEEASELIEVTIFETADLLVTHQGSTEICGGETVFLYTLGGVFNTYQWYNENGMIIGENNSNIEAAETGNYYVVGIDANACEVVSNELSITQNSNITPTISTNGNTSICEGETVILNAATGYNSYQWFFNGVPMYQANNSSLIATQAGDYMVSVTNNADCEGISEAINIELLTPPIPTISLDGPNTFCESGEVTLSVNDDFDNYQWFNENGAIAGANSIDFVPTTSGTYSVQVSNFTNCAGMSEAISVSINENTAPSISVFGNTDICEGESITLFALGNYTTILWYEEDAPTIPLFAGPSFVVNESGSYFIQVSDNTGCEGTSEPIKINVLEVETPTITIQGNSMICEGESITLSVEEEYDNYQWLLYGNEIVGANMATLTVNLPGLYSVVVANEIDCSAASNEIDIVVSPIPNVNIQSLGNTTICTGETVTLQVSGDMTNLNWYNNNNPTTSIGTSSTIMIDEAGTYYVIATNQQGCAATTEMITITMIESEAPTIAINGETGAESNLLCEGTNTTLTAIGNFSNYQWSINGNPIQGATQATYTVSQAGMYIVTTSNEGGCEEISTPIEILYETIPDLTIAAYGNNTEICEGNSVLLYTPTTFANYQWFFNDAPMTEATNNLNANMAGVYTLIGYTENNCMATSNSLTITVIEDVDLEIVTDGTTELCEGEEVTLTALSDAEEILWYSTLSENAIHEGSTIIISESGLYYAVANGEGICETISNEISITTSQCSEETADLSLFKFANTNSATTGDTIIYTISVLNNGTSDATSVQISDVLPTDLWFVSASDDNYNPFTGIWNVGEITSGIGKFLEITTVMMATTGTSLSNFAEVVYSDINDPDSTPNNGDPNGDLEDDEAMATIQLDLPEMVDLALEKVVNTTSPTTGDTITYTLSITNSGPDIATNVEITDYMPEGVMFLSSSSENFDNNTGIWNIETLNVGNTLYIDINVIVTATEGNISNFAEVTACDQNDSNALPDNGDPSTQPELWEDDEAAASFGIDNPTFIDLSLTKTANVSVVESGSMLTYSLTVSNNGTATATNIAVQDSLVEGLSFITAVPNDFDPLTGIWNIASLEVGQSTTLYLTTEVTTNENNILNYAQIISADQEDIDSEVANGDSKSDQTTWEDDEAIVLVEVVSLQPNECNDFTAIDNVVCANDDLTYQLIISMQGGEENGYIIQNNLTGEISSESQSIILMGSFDAGQGYSYTISLSDNPECSITLQQSLIDCVVTSIELLTFKGESQRYGNFLWWTTASEIENDYFELMRSKDGINFEVITKIEGAGTTNIIEDYEYLDNNAPNGISYYRLDFVDVDGKKGTSDVISLERGLPPFDVSLMPNPATDIINIGIASALPQTIDLVIFDMSGKLIRYQKLEDIQAHNIQVNIEEWASGVYLIQFLNHKTGRNLYQQRFIKH